VEDQTAARALLELSYFVKEISKDDGLTLNAYLKSVRELLPPLISDNLYRYLKSRSKKELKLDIKRIIIKKFNKSLLLKDVLNEKWKYIKKKHNYYYFERKNFYNVFLIPKKELPLFVNHIFDPQDKIIYLERLKGNLP
jgi:hypothetical protein